MHCINNNGHHEFRQGNHGRSAVRGRQPEHVPGPNSLRLNFQYQRIKQQKPHFSLHRSGSLKLSHRNIICQSQQLLRTVGRHSWSYDGGRHSGHVLLQVDESWEETLCNASFCGCSDYFGHGGRRSFCCHSCVITFLHVHILSILIILLAWFMVFI